MRYILIILLLSFFSCTSAPETNPYGLKIVQSISEYKQSVADNPEYELIDLEKYIPGIVVDMRYATTNNFTGEVVYDYPAALLRKPVADALKKAQAEFANMGLGLKVFDAYRPYTATVKFYELIGDTNFVAAPWHGSRHNRGAAVDVTLIILETGEELPMPTAFDEFTDKASPAYMDLPQDVLQNRANLLRIMAGHGFSVYPAEWWHFDFEGWERFPLMDIRIGNLVNE
jgi:zinc D-Ala-D-Ala dipeptidase